jgi:hypothetical protein
MSSHPKPTTQTVSTSIGNQSWQAETIGMARTWWKLVETFGSTLKSQAADGFGALAL